MSGNNLPRKSDYTAASRTLEGMSPKATDMWDAKGVGPDNKHNMEKEQLHVAFLSTVPHSDLQN